ncbi:hypothetical protein [Sporosarcina obsidiansis]|uniref:hypothetical protein n=1 Tax=Sporosarcina obsidiansis TaxID=2660748 RepID=UPI00129AC10A|nr:hypothetical protein [Sporosarcina obsidiansis]
MRIKRKIYKDELEEIIYKVSSLEDNLRILREQLKSGKIDVREINDNLFIMEHNSQKVIQLTLEAVKSVGKELN